jgi:hypothetical protein
MERRIVQGAVAIGFITAVLGLAAFATRAAEQMDMEKMVTGAKTAADHEQLAAEYDRQAAEAKAEADTHRKMAAAYRKAGGALISKLHFDQHCDALVRSYTAAAKEYEALAKAERQMAKEK